MSEESSRALTPLDPRHPLVIDTRELGRRPGAMRRFARSVPAPARLGVDVLGVPEGSAVALDLRLESVVEGVLVTGAATAHLEGECVRCLDPISRVLVVDLQELFSYPGNERDDDDDNELHQLQGDLLGLEPVLRDAVVLALPFKPLCREDCPGLCAQCGIRLVDDPVHHHQPADPRWEMLTVLSASTSPASTSSPPLSGPLEVPERSEES